MIHKCSWPIFLGVWVLSLAAIPNIVVAQTRETSEGDDVAQRLAAAREISASSGKPILAVVSNLDTT